LDGTKLPRHLAYVYVFAEIHQVGHARQIVAGEDGLQRWSRRSKFNA